MLRAVRVSAEVSVLLCGDRTIRALNRDWRGIDRPTDVLSFALEEARGPRPRSMPGGRQLGDVVISVQTARREAAAWNESYDAHVTRLLAHGLLHLCGHDHRTAPQRRRMDALTDRLILAASRRRRRE